jgi:hypothetical protein
MPDPALNSRTRSDSGKWLLSISQRRSSVRTRRSSSVRSPRSVLMARLGYAKAHLADIFNSGCRRRLFLTAPNTPRGRASVKDLAYALPVTPGGRTERGNKKAVKRPSIEPSEPVGRDEFSQVHHQSSFSFRVTGVFSRTNGCHLPNRPFAHIDLSTFSRRPRDRSTSCWRSRM